MAAATVKNSKSKGGTKAAVKKDTLAKKSTGTRPLAAKTKSAQPKRAAASKPAAKNYGKAGAKAKGKTTGVKNQSPSPAAVLESIGAPIELERRPISDLPEGIAPEPEQLVREEVVPSPPGDDEEAGSVDMPDMSLDSIIDEDCLVPGESSDAEGSQALDSDPDMDAGAIGETVTRNGSGELQLVCFSLGDEEYGVDIYRIQEINRSARVTQIPEAPFYVKGIINLRGNVIPILDLRLRLGLKRKEEDKNTRIIVFDYGNKLAGITVDGVTEVLRVPAKDLEKVPNQATTTGGEFLQGIIRQTDRLILVIDCEKILTM